jgi:hypothetical protein
VDGGYIRGMPTKTVSVEWESRHGHDIHVVRGQQSVALWEGLVLIPDVGPPVFGDVPTSYPGDVQSLTFVPLFRNTGPNSQGRFVNFGVEVEARTGQVFALATPPTTVVDNFVIEARVRLTTGGTKVARIRIHVHDRLDRAWLTPSTLSIRMGIPKPGHAFGVLAAFSDGTVGDISFDHEVTYFTAIPGNNSPVDLNNSTGQMVGRQPTATSQPETVTAQIPASLGGPPPGGNPTGKVNILPRWSGVPATFAGGAGRQFIDDVPNVLILGDGFQQGESLAFHELARQLVQQLWANDGMFPYGRLKGSMNFWSAFTPSREKGISTLPELYEVRTSRGPHGERVPIPQVPGAGSDVYRLAELVYLVGLPTRQRAALAEQALIGYWTSVFDNVVASRINTRLVNAWKALATRKLANEHDTAFGLVNGRRPRREEEEKVESIFFHHRRGNRADLDVFISALVDRLDPVNPNNPIGRLWNSTPAQGQVGKSRDRVVVLCAGAVRSGNAIVNADDLKLTDLIGVALADTLEVPIRPGATPPELEAPGHGLPIRPGGRLSSSSLAVHVMAHELTHSFALGDEYGIQPGEIPAPIRAMSEARHNLYVRPGPPHPPLSAENVPWRWPRLAKAAALTGPPQRVGATQTYRLPMSRRQVAFFRVGQVARLRAALPGRVVSDALTVRSINPTDNVVVVDDSSGTLAAQLANFPAGSVLCVPVPALPPAGSDQWAELMARRTRLRVNTTRGPLNAPSEDPTRPCAPGRNESEDQPSSNWPSNGRPNPPADPTWIVGLYEGGSTYACGIYHPTNRCRMRMLTDRFCLVCQYVLIDLIDARVHGVLERRIRDQKLYPLPS